MFNWFPKASNAILLDECVGGKGRYFKARFLQPGLVKYSFGVCILDKETIDKFVDGFVGCPVIIDHQDVTNENAKDICCGDICHVWYDEQDGWYWLDGIIRSKEALSLINDGYNISCQYEITEYAENRNGNLHNGNEYDKVILNGKPEHLAIVKNPRYENALIAVNAIAVNGDDEQQFRTAEDGHVYPLDDDGDEYDDKGHSSLLNQTASKILKSSVVHFRRKKAKPYVYRAELTGNGEIYYHKLIPMLNKMVGEGRHRWHLRGIDVSFPQKDELDGKNSMEDKMAQNAKDEKGKWITIKGTHVFIKDGQSVEEAMKEHGFGKSSKSSSTEKKKEKKSPKQAHKLQVQLEDLKSQYNEVMREYWEADEDKRDELQYKADALKDEMHKLEDRLKPMKETFEDDKHDELKDKYAKEDADFDIEQMNKDVKFLKDEGYSIEEVAEHLGLDEDEVRMSGVFDDEEDKKASNSLLDQFKEGLYDIAANKIIDNLENEGFLKR